MLLIPTSVVMIPTSRAFFHLFTMVNHIASVLQSTVFGVNYGALLRSMLVETTWESGDTVTATVTVIPVLFY